MLRTSADICVDLERKDQKQLRKKDKARKKRQRRKQRKKSVKIAPMSPKPRRQCSRESDTSALAKEEKNAEETKLSDHDSSDEEHDTLAALIEMAKARKRRNGSDKTIPKNSLDILNPSVKKQTMLRARCPKHLTCAIVTNPGSIFICPLTAKLMDDPVVISDGWTYERSAIEKYLKEDFRSPVTGEMLEQHEKPVPNLLLKDMITEFKDSFPVSCI